MIPIGTDRPQRRLPLMNLAIILANVVIYMLSHYGGRASSTGLVPGWDPFVLSAYDPKLYQFITYQFLHQNFAHIAGNMVFLYVFGNNLNEKLGHIGYLAFYLAGGVLAGCGQLVFSNADTLGASGSISAVTGLFFVLLPRTHVRIFVWIIVYVDVLEIPSMYFILLNVLKDIFEPWIIKGSHVAYQAHLSGTAAGFLIGMLLLLSGLVQRDHYDLLALVNRYRRRKQYEAMVSRTGDPFDPARGVQAVEATPAPAMSPAVTAARDAVLERIDRRDVPGAAEQYLKLRALDPMHVLPPHAQLDVANQLMAAGRQQEAAEAYEDYLRAYPTASHIDQVQLVLGLMYAGYFAKSEIPRPQRAIELLRAALPRLADHSQRQVAEAELSRLGAV